MDVSPYFQNSHVDRFIQSSSLWFNPRPPQVRRSGPNPHLCLKVAPIVPTIVNPPNKSSHLYCTPENQGQELKDRIRCISRENVTWLWNYAFSWQSSLQSLSQNHGWEKSSVSIDHLISKDYSQFWLDHHSSLMPGMLKHWRFLHGRSSWRGCSGP